MINIAMPIERSPAILSPHNEVDSFAFTSKLNTVSNLNARTQKKFPSPKTISQFEWIPYSDSFQI